MIAHAVTARFQHGLLAFLFLLIAAFVVRESSASRAVNGAGLGASSSAYRPPLSYVINVVSIGDSICNGYTTSNPPTTSWVGQAVAAARTLSYTVNFTDLCQVSSSGWEWTCPGGFNCPFSSYVQVGQHNVFIIAVGTNDFSGGSINGAWFHDLPVTLNTALVGTVSPVSAVATGATTTITLSDSRPLANRSIGDWVMVAGSGVTGLDDTCAQITNVGASTLTLAITSSGSTSATGTAYVCTGTGGPLQVAFFVPTVAGTTATCTVVPCPPAPSWILAGGTSDGSVTWGAAQAQTIAYTKAQANILTLASEGAAAGFNVAVTTLLPRAHVGQGQTVANQESQRIAFSAWETSVLGTNGIKVVIPFASDPRMAANVAQTSTAVCSGTPCYSDGTHPGDNGSAYLGQTYGMQAIFNAVR